MRDRVWFHLNNFFLQGLDKKIKAMWYGPFELLEKVGYSAYKFSVPPEMRIYSIVHVENLKFYEPSMLDQEIEEQGLPTIEELTSKA
jgi:hypothetical protein